MKMRDELGSIYDNAQFVDLFPRRGQAAESPWRFASVAIMQFAENLTDRQAADAVRSRNACPIFTKCAQNTTERSLSLQPQADQSSWYRLAHC